MRLFWAMACTVALAGCAWEAPMSDVAAASGSGYRPTSERPAAVRVNGVPFHSQQGFRCGPAAMAMAIGWSGIEIDPTELEGRFLDPQSDPRVTLSDTAWRYGRLAYPVIGMARMMDELAAGHPVIVLQNLGVASDPLWNCAVAIGYDRAKDEILLHSGGQPAKRMSTRLIERLWAETAEWGMVVIRPGDLPATAERAPYLTAARGLEEAGRYWEAVLAYDAALSRWPAEPAALMGLGSSLYLLGDPEGAADAYQAAAAVGTDPAPALDAMAHILAEMGRRDEAAAAAAQAVALGGPHKASHERTLKSLMD